VKTGGVYLKNWQAFVKKRKTVQPFLEAQVEVAARAVRRQLALVPVRQAPELDLVRMATDLPGAAAAPLVPGGPRRTLLTVVLSGLFMLRSISLRTLLKSQVEVNEEERLVKISLRKRKGTVDARPHLINLVCCCGLAPLCPYCLTKLLKDKRTEEPGTLFFVNAKNKAISREALRQTYARLGMYAASGHTPLPHSGRISGARLWTRLGLTLETTAAIGGWADIKTLKYYVGAAILTRRMRRELGAEGREDAKTSQLRLLVEKLNEKVDKLMVPLTEVARAGGAEWWPGESRQTADKLLVLMEKLARTWGGRSGTGEPRQNAEQDPADEIRRSVSIVREDRRPRRWHEVSLAVGPVSGWTTACGEHMNLTTMSLCPWSSRTSQDPLCAKCARNKAKKEQKTGAPTDQQLNTVREEVG